MAVGFKIDMGRSRPFRGIRHFLDLRPATSSIRTANVQVSIPADPRFQGQIDVTWWVDHSCSGVTYATDILIMGPEGVPYW